MTLSEALIDSWVRQARIVKNVAGLVDESNRKAKPSEDGWPLDHQLAHIHLVRQYWLSRIDPERADQMEEAFTDKWTTPIDDLDKIKRLLDESASAIHESMSEQLQGEMKAIGGYDNQVLFLEHMIWHEGWHVGLLFLGLRLNGQEPQEEWEEPNVWGLWRTE